MEHGPYEKHGNLPHPLTLKTHLVGDTALSGRPSVIIGPEGIE